MKYESDNQFVKQAQDKVKKFQGRDPRLSAEDKKFNANMMNTGEHAQKFGRTLTEGLDKTAFPVK